jgi:hypothetical protein
MSKRYRFKRKDKRRKLIIFSCCLFLFVTATVLLVYYNMPPSQPEVTSNQPSAAIVDHLSSDFPNQTFVETATSILQQAGYTVDYYPTQDVTVDFYRNLPTHGYSIILLRVHSAIAVNTKLQELAFFTSEIYSPSEYTLDQLDGRLGCATIHNPPNPGEPEYFAIRRSFVEDSMIGRFNGTTIIVMGCYGMKYTSMAEAFIEKGAKVYIGWDGLEDADHSDAATVDLLRQLLLEKQAVGQAVENTIKEVGEDPAYNSSLLFYPAASAGITVVSSDQRPVETVFLITCVRKRAVKPVSAGYPVMKLA